MSFKDVVLDKLEPRFTKTAKYWRNKPPPRWLAPLCPDLFLTPRDNYSTRLYLRQATILGVFVVLLEVLGWLFPIAYVWYRYHSLFYIPRYHRVFIGMLAHEGFYWFPWAILGLLAFNYALHWPRWYFWNRRATRLQREAVLRQDVVNIEAADDPYVWPPAPKRDD